MNHEIRLVRRPTDMPTQDDFELVETPVPEPGPGELLLRNVYLSVDPYMRARMVARDVTSTAYEVGQTMRGGAVGRVEASNHPDFSVGDWVSSRMGWRAYFTSNGGNLLRIDAEAAPASAYLGALGMTGLTAYVGMLDVGEPQRGETVFVSGAAGAVGSIAGQLAKLRGCRIIGSAGSDEKVRVLREELGFDAAFNYRSGDIEGMLGAAAPDGLDLYFDNVGGEHLQAAINHMNPHGRVVVCGMISQHRGESAAVPNNLGMISGRRITIRGFVVGDHGDRLNDFMRDMQGWLADGSVKHRETIVQGIDHAVEAFLSLYEGENIGKLVVQIGAA